MANGVAIRKTVRAGQLRGISAGALILALAMPGAALAQAAQIPATASPGTPTHTDPSPAQTAVVPTTTEATPQAADGAAVTAPQQDGDGAAPESSSPVSAAASTPR
jgi:iron complex outermembrane receptor protein